MAATRRRRWGSQQTRQWFNVSEVEADEEASRDELLVVLVLVFLVVRIDAGVGLEVGYKRNLTIRHFLDRLVRPRCRSVATDGTATIALKGLDNAARMKGVILAVQHDAAAWTVDRIHADQWHTSRACTKPSPRGRPPGWL